MIAVTGATGHLGRLVIEALLATQPASSIVAAARNPASAADLAAKGIVVRHADYDRPETLEAALAGVDRLLLISSSEVGQRARQHGAVIDAAGKAGVSLIAYTSILKADATPVALAVEHRATEAAIRASGLPFVFLRNGWYTENYAGVVPMAVQHGAVMGSARDGRVSAASRRDFADAAAAVLTSTASQAGRVYELAGDTSFTLTELAAEITSQSGKPVAYGDMPQAAYEEALVKVGLPAPVAAMLADSDVGVAAGWLHDDGQVLSGLIGRPTTPFGETVTAALKG